MIFQEFINHLRDKFCGFVAEKPSGLFASLICVG
jgi:hypothetical protein